MTKLGFIGCGKMAGAILEGVVKSGKFSGDQIYLSDKDTARVKELAASCGAQGLGSNVEVARSADVLLICVKPNDVAGALAEMQEALAGKLLISIAAGVTMEQLQDYSRNAATVVRVMPNTPALVHRGATAYTLSATATEQHAAVVEEIFGAVGKVFRVAESALDAVTGLSGSGPAYVYTVIEALADGGVLMGLPRELALQLAAQTVVGAGEMVVQTQMHPAALRDMVTSPGGTTIAAMEALEKGGLRAALLAAVRAATERSAAMRQTGK
ncbi:MAG TPA: pyrroline-5-carboxylate reductase [Chthoniobacterales bacterium]|jgi:pyrroline-5-carboxylate reductase